MQIEKMYGYTTSAVNNESNNKNQMDKEQFLKILVTQLRYQDPLKPLEDKEFISQMAQFSTLEQMQNMSSEFSMFKALNLTGKMIYGEKDVDNASEIIPVMGRVNHISMNNGKVYVNVAGLDLEIGEVKRVFSEEEANKMENTTQGVE